MDTVKVVGKALGDLATIARDPALGYRGAALQQSLAMLSKVLVEGSSVAGDMGAFLNQLSSMAVDGNREPSKNEFYDLRDFAEAHLRSLKALSEAE